MEGEGEVTDRFGVVHRLYVKDGRVYYEEVKGGKKRVVDFTRGSPDSIYGAEIELKGDTLRLYWWEVEGGVKMRFLTQRLITLPFFLKPAIIEIKGVRE